jgi:ABC-type multidrug transport system ATPase subunit
MKISCEVNNLGHRYQGKFLFQNLSFELEPGKVNMVKGNNGKGKSTLLKILSFGMEPVEGKVTYKMGGGVLEEGLLFSQVGIVAPYLELPEDLTLSELMDFQLKTIPGIGTIEGYRTRLIFFGMDEYKDRFISQYSTGMKQKARLILCLTENRKIWILDEPGSNLDPESSEKLWQFINENLSDRLVIVASNDPSELNQADFSIDL